MKRVNVAIIGCGYWGPNLIRNFLRIKNCAVKYVCDVRKERLEWIKEIYPSLYTLTDYEVALKDPEIQAVAIATPVSTHYQIACASLNAGKHVLVEKPLTRTLEEAEKLVELAREKKKVLMVSHTYLYSPGIRKLKEIIEKGMLGEIMYINSIRVNLGLFQKDINVVTDLAPHDLSILGFLLGRKPEYISCTGASHYTDGIEDVAFLTLYYSDNLIAHIHVSWIDPIKLRKITLVGKKKMAIYDDLDSNEPLKIIDKSVEKIPYYKTYGEFRMLYRFGDISSPHISSEEPLYVECCHFIECIQHSKPPLTNGMEGKEIVRILEIANQSLKNKGAVLKV